MSENQLFIFLPFHYLSIRLSILITIFDAKPIIKYKILIKIYYVILIYNIIINNNIIVIE